MKISVCTSLNIENLSSLHYFSQQNEHISVKKMKRMTTCKAVNFFSNIACVKIFNSDISFTSTSTFIKLVNSVQKSHQPTRMHSEKTK